VINGQDKLSLVSGVLAAGACETKCMGASGANFEVLFLKLYEVLEREQGITSYGLARSIVCSMGGLLTRWYSLERGV
jgi:hypothetical protein